MQKFIFLFVITTICIGACSTSPSKSNDDNGKGEKAVADIISVQVAGSENAYAFSVGIQSPDTGCGQYADWWEVLSESGQLLYRRILTHSHVNEQPFVRSGGPVAITADDKVYIRAHMHPSGYGGTVYSGKINSGFASDNNTPQFAESIESQLPLPDGCAF